MSQTEVYNFVNQKKFEQILFIVSLWVYKMQFV